MFRVEITKEGFGKNNTGRPMWCEPIQEFDTFEIAYSYVEEKANAQFEVLKDSSKYENIYYHYSVIIDNSGSKLAKEIVVYVEDNQVVFKTITPDYSKEYSEEQLDLGANLTYEILKTSCQF